MTESAQNLTQQIQEQAVNSAKDFYGNALGEVKGQLESSRSQLTCPRYSLCSASSRRVCSSSCGAKSA